MPSLAAVVAALDRRYDQAWAEDWDAVGLVCGDPGASVERVHFAVDPVEIVAEEAIAAGAQLLVTHHPLFLGGTTSVAATSSKGRVIHQLIGAGVALYVAHTNADVANPGVNDALASLLELRDTEPLVPGSSAGLGLGRVGSLAAPTTLGAFTREVGRLLPATVWGVRAAGDLERPVRRVAVCGGSGGSLAETAAALGAEVLVTSDLKHHATSESVAELGMGMIDAAHWATEAPWLDVAAGLLASDLAEAGTNVECAVSRIVTDPWTTHCHQGPPAHPADTTEDS